MGDAFLPFGDDAAAGLFYNPADLGKIRKTEFEPINLSFYGDGGYFSSLDSNFYNVWNLNSYSSTVQKNSGKMLGAGASLLPNIGFKGFSFGILGQSQLAAKASGSSVTYQSLYQIIPAIGTGFRLANGIIRIGYSLQWVNSAAGTYTSATTSGLAYNQNLTQGSALSHNFGLAITVPIAFLPSLNAVVRNAFGAHYVPFVMLQMASGSTGTPATEPMTFDASFSIQPRLGRGVSINLSVEDRDITNQANAIFMAHLAVGIELVFGEKFFIRGGYGSGYPSAGLGIRGKSTEFSLAWFTEELGTSYLQQGDNRFMLQYQIKAF